MAMKCLNIDKKTISLVNKIIAYESGELSDNDTLELFAELIRTGQAWALQGHYGRMAHNLIQFGFIDTNGKILRRYGEDEG
jgi:two-component SAPR family response regulator